MLCQVHSCFSIKYGILQPDELVLLLQELGYRRVALTDINSTAAISDFFRRAPQSGVTPVAGIDFRNGATSCFIGLAASGKGYRLLNDYLSFHLHRQLPFPQRMVPLEDTRVIYPFRYFQEYEKLEENEYIGIQLRDLNRLRFSPWLRHPDKLVLMHTATFRHRKDFNTHRLLRAIDNNTLLSKLEKTEEGHPDDLFLTSQALKTAVSDFSFLIRNTEKLLESCDLTFEYGENKNQLTYTGHVAEDRELIRSLCHNNLHYRYPNAGEQVLQRMEKELEIIEQKGFLSYFLINWDIIQYARSKDYFYVGRGSGANSILAYLLQITDVDPIELDLYFERFINLYRRNPPDFDIDFSWTDRDDMTRYIFSRFPQVCLLGAYNTFQYRAVVRELGKVFGLPNHEIELLAADKENRSGSSGETFHLIKSYGKRIHSLPSHLSVHASGILISQNPVHEYTATFLPPKGFPTTQFDMVAAEDIGLYKFDILSQRGLGKIKDCLSIIRENQPEAVLPDIHDIPRFKRDEKIKNLLRQGKAMGCFYVESPAMRMLLKKLLVDDYLGLVAASSIIRPGVSKSGMMNEYIRRHRNPERRKEAHPVMLSIIPETYGVMVYQEDVIKVAHYFAGLNLAEADVLRRGMSGKFRSREEFAQVQDQYFRLCREKGYPDTLSREVWRQIASFAGFAFAKGHSASYAVESYQSLFLKAHYPLEFMVAVINNFGGFYPTEIYVHEARMEGAVIHAPCINRSHYTTGIYGKDIYLGFMHLGGLENQWIKNVLNERTQHGPFSSFEDFMERVSGGGIEQISILIQINAFRFTGRPRRELLWKAHLLFSKERESVNQPSLFRTQAREYLIPNLYEHPLEESFDQMELLGFSLGNPFDLLDEVPENRLLASDLPANKGREVQCYGYLVTIKETTSSKGERMHFGTFLDQDGQFLDTVHFPSVARQFPFRGKGVYELRGKVIEEFGFYSIDISFMRKLHTLADPRYSDKISPAKRLQP